MATYNKSTRKWTPNGNVPSVLEPPSAGPSELEPIMSTPGDPNTTTPPGSPPVLAMGFSSERPKDVLANASSHKRSPVGPIPQRPQPGDSPQLTQEPVGDTPEAGPSTAPVRKVYPRKPKKKAEKTLQYTNAYAPGLYNVKNPAGDFLQKESNVEVVRQVSQARLKRQKEALEAGPAQKSEEKDEEEVKEKDKDKGKGKGKEKDKSEGEDSPNPLAYTLIIHPGSRNLRIGRASDFYPKEVPFCIARPETLPNRGKDPPVPGSGYKRQAEEARDRREQKRQRVENGHVASNGHGEEEEEEWVDPVDLNIEDLRDYLRNRLRVNRLSTDHRDGFRVKQHNAKVRPEAIPEHNDPYRIDWTEVNGKEFFVGTEALRLPSGSGFKVRYPVLHRGLNTRDWGSPQLLMDDIAIILHETLRTELDIRPKDYNKYSVVFLVPDHNERLHLQAFVSLLFGEFGFKEMAIHQESHAAIFSAGMSTACVVDIGATSTSVACVDEGMLLAETRIELDYGGDDITTALVALLERANFPYHELNLAKPVDWMMMDKLKEKICTLEEHMVANISWDIYALREQGLTQKYQLRTYDENILAPLCFFDTRMIDFKEKAGSGRIKFWEESGEIDDMLSSGYGEATGAMRACCTHLLPPALAPEVQIVETPNGSLARNEASEDAANGAAPALPAEVASADALSDPRPLVDLNGSQPSTNGDKAPGITPAGSRTGTPSPNDAAAPADSTPAPPAISAPVQTDIPLSAWEGIDVVSESSRSPLDAAIAAAISMAGTENKVKAAAGNILLIGGGSALKGLYPFISERLPPLLRAKGLLGDVSIVPPPRNLNPRFVSWKGASVMCNLESLSDMWIGRDEWEAIGARSLKDRLLFL